MDINFKIATVSGPVSEQFRSREIKDFVAAQRFIKHLPYKRNEDKEDQLAVFRDGFGTCGTKHAVLRRLAWEQGHEEVQLYMGIFRMSGVNTPAVRPVLEQFQLPFIPEAHNYLKAGETIIDCTKAGTSGINFVPYLMEEQLIVPEQIGAYKVNYHKVFMEQWRQESAVNFTLQKLWQIREACIAALSS